MPPSRVVVEAVACSVEDALTAQACGADRIELCSAIELAGLTPTIGLVRQVLGTCPLPVMGMLRPRSGDFDYSEHELATMEADAEAMASLGVHGLVFGVLDSESRISKGACRRVIRAAGSGPFVFHRAFDAAADQHQSLEELIDLGFDRVLTSGQGATALDGAHRLRALHEAAEGRIEVMAGGGIRASNVREVLRIAQVRSIHLAPQEKFAGHGRLCSRELEAVVGIVRESNPSGIE